MVGSWRNTNPQVGGRDGERPHLACTRIAGSLHTPRRRLTITPGSRSCHRVSRRRCRIFVRTAAGPPIVTAVAGTASVRGDVLVAPAEVCRVVLPLERGQASELGIAVGLPDAGLPFLHEEVDVDTGVERRQGGPVVAGPLALLLEPLRARRVAVDVEGEPRGPSVEPGPRQSRVFRERPAEAVLIMA